MLMEKRLSLCVLYNIIHLTITVNTNLTDVFDSDNSSRLNISSWSLQNTTNANHVRLAVEPVTQNTPDLSPQTQQNIRDRDDAAETKKATMNVSTSPGCRGNIEIQGLSGVFRLGQVVSFHWECTFTLQVAPNKIVRFQIVECCEGTSLEVSDYFSVIRENRFSVSCSFSPTFRSLYSMTDTVTVRVSYTYSFWSWFDSCKSRSSDGVPERTTASKDGARGMAKQSGALGSTMVPGFESTGTGEMHHHRSGGNMTTPRYESATRKSMSIFRHNFILHFSAVNRSARHKVELELIHLSSSAGYLQTPGWDVSTQLPSFMRSCVTLTRPTHHIIFVSPVSWDEHTIFSFLGQCGLRQRFLEEPKRHSFPLFLFPDDFVEKTSVSPTHLSLFFSSGNYDLGQSSGFRLHFSFHLENLKPRQVPSWQSSGRKTRWNCSVSVWPDLTDHFPCDLVPQCAESEDEYCCPYTTERCGLGNVETGGKCYSYDLSVELRDWTEAERQCQERGAFLVSLETAQEWKDVVNVMKDIKTGRSWIGLTTIGLKTKKKSLHTMYTNTLRWESGCTVFFLSTKTLPDKPACGQLSWTRSGHELRFEDCESEKKGKAGNLCEFQSSSNHHRVSKPVIIPAPYGTSVSRVPLVTCPLQHVTHELLACDSKSLCSRLESTAEWYRGICNTPLGQTQEYFYCGTCGKFVPYTVVCDFREDCVGGDDEVFCVHAACKTHMMYCGKGQCIDNDKRCDGYKDCMTNLDEVDCAFGDYVFSNVILPAVVNFDKPGAFSVTPLPRNSTKCPDTHFQCHNDGYCLPVYVRCNDVNDCPGHEDEAECHNYMCPGFFRCRDSDKTVCVHVDHLCDGLPQCPIHDDELLCNLICPEACICFGLAFTCTQTFNVNSFSQLRYLEAKGSGLDQTDVADNLMLIHLGVEACGWKSLTNLVLPNLHSLDLSHNLFRSVNFSHLARMRHLRSLNLAGNPVSGSVFDVSPKFILISFIVFNFSRVQAESLNISVLSTAMPNLQVLDLSWNNIKSLKGRDLFQTVRVLDLLGCPISDFSPHIMKSMTSLEYVYAQNFKLCCSVVLPDIFRGKCLSPSDEISSCADLLKSVAYRCALALFAVFAICGNFFGFVYRLYVLLKGTNTGFAVFVLHLCVSDLLMGIYLVFIGVADQIYAGIYLWNDTAWKTSPFCTIAGFLSFLSSEVSAFLVCLITFDRFLVLHFPFSQIRFGITSAHRACITIWTVGLILAAVPLLPATSHWEFYQQTGICIPLPITRADFAGHTYSFSVMVICNLVLFLLIAMGQSLIYWSVRRNAMSEQVTKTKNTGGDSVQSKEAAIARRLLTIAMSDFLCWFPVGLCGVLAAMDVIIPGEINVAMAIFVLPLNSALNPFLYTLNVILEKQRKAKELRFLHMLRAQQKR